MTKAEYESYLLTARWRELSRAMRQAYKKCQRCEFPYELNVHHTTYERVGHEEPGDLIVLCRSCHAREHFLEDLDHPIVGELLRAFTGKNSNAQERIRKQQEETREKNRDREHEIKKNKAKEDY